MGHLSGASRHLQVPGQRSLGPALALVHTDRSPATRWRGCLRALEADSGAALASRARGGGSVGAGFIGLSMTSFPSTSEGRSRYRTWLVPCRRR